MSSSVSITTPGEGLGQDGGQSSSHPHPRRQTEPARESEAPAPADPGQRLVIEETESGLVYTVIDRATGAVVARTSREDVTRMGTQADYAAGALIRTTA